MIPEDVRWHAHPRCGKPHGLWSAPDKDATEVEVTNFIAALVRLTKPSVVVETGTYTGRTTAAIASAMQMNGVGVVATFEVDPERAVAAYDALRELVDAGVVRITAAAITSDSCPHSVEVAFLDSGMRTRGEDMAVVWPRLTPGGIVLVHDASPERPPGRVTPPGPHQMFDIATPRGLTVFQKPWNA